MNMQTAILGAGFQPTKKIKPTIENVIDGLFEPTIRNRKVVITKAGELYKARYEGRKDCVFIYEPENAAKRLKYFDGGVRNED